MPDRAAAVSHPFPGRAVGAAVGLLLWGMLAPLPGAASPVDALELTSDPLAVYHVLELRRRDDKALELVTRREAPSGTLYARRAFDCRAHKTRALGTGTTLERMKASRPPRKWTPLIPDSIAGELATWACAQSP